MSANLDEINFKGGNPGAVRYGNFINYYQFHPAEDRINMLPTDVLKSKDYESLTCLDIGCNAGDLTTAVQNYLHQNVCQEVNMLGIDIDPTLILRAQENNKNSKHLKYECLNIMDNKHIVTIQNYLQENNKTKFDIIFCFSVTMWIHLNHGDDGLKNFLSYICDISDLIIIEPQPWKCYRTAVKRLKLSNHEFPHFKELQIRNDVENKIESILQALFFEKVSETPQSNWGRKIVYYANKRL